MTDDEVKRITPAQASLMLDAVDLEELYGLGELPDDPIIEGFIHYTGLLTAMVMLYRSQLRDPVTVGAIRDAARANAKRVIAGG